MFKAISALFKRIFSHPEATVEGLGNLALAGATCYGMAKGKVPLTTGIPAASQETINGIAALTKGS